MSIRKWDCLLCSIVAETLKIGASRFPACCCVTPVRCALAQSAQLSTTLNFNNDAKTNWPIYSCLAVNIQHCKNKAKEGTTEPGRHA